MDPTDADHKKFRYPSYVQDIMGPMCFDYGFGPFRWVCAKERLFFFNRIAPNAAFVCLCFDVIVFVSIYIYLIALHTYKYI